MTLTKTIVSAGGVVYRCDESTGPQVVLVIPVAEPERWALPKGLLDLGESIEEAALREVAEETGLQTTIESILGVSEYDFIRQYPGDSEPVAYHKTVHYFLMRHVGGELLAAANDEIAHASWVPIMQALERITFKGERDVLRIVRDRLLAHSG